MNSVDYVEKPFGMHCAGIDTRSWEAQKIARIAKRFCPKQVTGLVVLRQTLGAVTF